MTILPTDKTVHRPAEETPTVQLSSLPAEGLTPGAVLGTRYRIVSLLGRGGMGEVYRADDLRLGQPVALKFLSRQTAIDERLLHDEVRIGRQVSHPNVCRLYDIEEVDGRIFIAMEYVDGEDLAALLRRVGRLAPDKALGVARDLCAGLGAAHELGVIHRDLKPGNVLIDGRGRARVTDFGLAVEHDRVQHSAGTPAYMAPEQLAGHRATMQSDLYSLGLVMYEIFTGRRALDSTSLGEIQQQQREQRFLRPSAIVPDMNPAVEQAILRCLEPDPAHRPASVHELVRELPGFDPVAAALAAGETPSAGLIAASAKKGDLSVRAAWSLLVLAIAGVLVAAATAPMSMLVSGSSAKPPEVLLERARDVLRTAGVTAKPHDHGFSYEDNPASRSTPIEFLYRESQRPMMSHDILRRLTVNSPPLIWPGMTLVRLDPNGRLLEFAAVPPKREPADGAGSRPAGSRPAGSRPAGSGQRAAGSGDAVIGGAVSGDAGSGGAVSRDAVSRDAGSGDAVSGDAVSGGAGSGGAGSGGAVSGGAVSGDAVIGGAVSGDAAHSTARRPLPAARSAPDWPRLLAFTGIEPGRLIPAAPEMTARSDSDAKRAWTVRGTGTRIEAASYHGRPVWLAVIEPPPAARPLGTRRGVIEPPRPDEPLDSQLAAILELALIIILPATALILAWQNFRRGSSDRRGAFRLAAVFFIDLFLATLLRMHHASGFTVEWLQISLAAGETTFISIIVGLAYLAIEPLVRRRWPEMLIAWSRLLALRWRDPMVGRDVLIGVVCGTGIAIAQRMTVIAPRWLGAGTEPLLDLPAALESPAVMLSFLLHALLVSIYKCLFSIVLVLLVRALVKRLDVAIVVSMIVSVPLLSSDATGPLAARIAYGVVAAIVVYAVLFRFGLLALVSTGYIGTLLFYVPLTLDTSSWYFPRALLVLLVLGGIAFFGFHTALAGKRWLPRLAM